MDITIDTLARTIWGEARGEGEDGMTAVACVIMNRFNSRVKWWGTSVLQICLKPWQFSCWNENDANRIKCLAVREDDPIFASAIEIAEDVLAGKIEDVTNGADHYYSKDMRTEPNWIKGKNPVAEIGNHKFYRLER